MRPFFPWVFLKATVRTARVSTRTIFQSMTGIITNQKVDQSIEWWASGLLKDAHIRLIVRGREHLEPYAPMVIMSNHQSLYDIPAILVALPPSVRMLAKKELFKVPIWGRAMLAAGFIRIDRSNREEAVRSLRVARKRLESGIHVWIAPEGTRSRTGELLPFKKGGFILASEMSLPILPVTVNGARKALPAGTWSLQAGTDVEVTIHPRVPPPANGNRTEWMREVRARIESAL
jgi:1-acyl-sn-glycerol-3-phosphate acyltransferase